MTDRIGKINSAKFGMGGYQDAQFGLSVDLVGEGWGVGDFNGFWATKRSDHAKWSAEDQNASFAATSHHIVGLLSQAKVRDVSALAGKPVMVSFDGNTLSSWRILTEAI